MARDNPPSPGQLAQEKQVTNAWSFDGFISQVYHYSSFQVKLRKSRSCNSLVPSCPASFAEGGQGVGLRVGPSLGAACPCRSSLLGRGTRGA